MLNKLLPQIMGKDLHALWILFQGANCFCQNELSAISQKILLNSEEDDIRSLLQLAESLGLVEQNSIGWIVTREGNKFGACSHWRLWNPPDDIKSLLRESNQSHFFISEDIYKHRPVAIDLFAGVGGLSLGFTAAGFNVALAIDNDPQACEAHQRNFPDTKVILDDIDNFANDPINYLAKTAPHLKELKISGVIGGPPCQGFSYIGERDTEDERNLLTSKFMDIVLALKPDFFVMENVPGLITSGLAPKFGTYIKRLSKAKGKYASIIVNRLPPIPKQLAKRNRQYKIRLLSDVINILKSDIDRQFVALSSGVIKNNILLIYENFKKTTSEKLIGVYGPQIILTALKEIENEIFALATVSLIDALLIHKKLKEESIREFLYQLQNSFADMEAFSQTISSLYKNYDETSKAEVYGGQRIGPVLLHLLERAKEFYDVPTPQILNAALAGTPQNRKRLFIIGIRKEYRIDFSYPEPTYSLNGSQQLLSVPTTYDALHDLPDIDTMPHLLDEHEFNAKELKPAETDFVRMMRYELIPAFDFSMPPITWNPYSVDCSNRTTHKNDIKERLVILEPGKQDEISRRVRLHPHSLSPTLRAGTKENKGSHTAMRPIHYEYNRVISVREGARLMGYPDWMTFHKAKWHGFRLVGNGVPFLLSYAVAKQIKRFLHKER